MFLPVQIDAKLYVMKEILPDGKPLLIYALSLFICYVGLEQQIIPHTVEVVTCYLINKQDPQGFTLLVSRDL